MKYYIKPEIMNSYLIEHYGFKAIPWSDKYNLEYRDEARFGLEIWWADRSIRIILGDHAEYGVCPIPPLLVQMLNDGVVESRLDE